MQLDTQISLTGISAIGYHGVLPEERVQGQEFIVDLLLEIAPPSKDELIQTVNYAELAQLVVAEITGEPCQLIETLAQRIAIRVLENSKVKYVSVTVHKPKAPISVQFQDVTVTVRYHND